MLDVRGAEKILDFVGDFQTRSEKVMRFVGHPYVEGDSVAEHLTRLQRLLVYVTPFLKEEFPKERSLIEDISRILLLHDDDEIIVGFDVITQIKPHTNDKEEVREFRKQVGKLGKKVADFLTESFEAFRLKETRASKIAKALDNLAGNQVLVEQRLALINPDATKFTVEYAKKVRGASKTTDALVDAQIKQILDYRKFLKTNKQELARLIDLLKIKNEKKYEEVIVRASQLLQIDISLHTYEVQRALTPLQKLK